MKPSAKILHLDGLQNGTALNILPRCLFLFRKAPKIQEQAFSGHFPEVMGPKWSRGVGVGRKTWVQTLALALSRLGYVVSSLVKALQASLETT